MSSQRPRAGAHDARHRARGDVPFPGAVECPSCWGSTPRHTATFNRVTHHDAECGRYCLMAGLGSRNIGAVTGLGDRVRDWVAAESSLSVPESGSGEQRAAIQART